MNRIHSSISVVVPVYNSENTLFDLTEKLKRVLKNFDAYEIIFVDDVSLDSSFQVIIKIVNDNVNITGITLCKNSGQQSAILCGLRFAKHDYTVIIDDDLEQNPDDIILLYQEIKGGYDTVYAIQRNNRLFNAGSFMRDILFRFLTKIPRGIKVSSFRILNRNTRNQVIMTNTEFVYISMEILKSTTNIGNIKTMKGPKAKSNYSLRKLFRLYCNIIKTYSNNFIFKRNVKTAPCYEIKEIYKGEHDSQGYILHAETKK